MTTRREFIKTAAAGIGAATLGTSGVTQAGAPASGSQLMPRGLTLLSMLQSDGSETLGVKLPSGILDFARASKALKIDAPITLDSLLETGNSASLDQLISAAKEKKEFLKEEASIKFGRLFTDPGKIVCLGLN